MCNKFNCNYCCIKKKFDVFKWKEKSFVSVIVLKEMKLLIQ